MKTIIYIITSLLLFSCSTKSYKYKIEGKVRATVNKGDHIVGYKKERIVADAIAFTDTIHGYNDDSIWYYNSDGSVTTLLPPYVIYKIK